MENDNKKSIENLDNKNNKIENDEDNLLDLDIKNNNKKNGDRREITENISKSRFKILDSNSVNIKNLKQKLSNLRGDNI